MMRKMLFSVLVFLFLSACGPQPIRALDQYDLNKGARRVYDYQAYAASTSDPNKVVKASFQLTEFVADKTVIPSYVIAHVVSQLTLISSDPGWSGAKGTTNTDLWYVAYHQQIFTQKTAVDVNNIRTDLMTFAYDFPLVPKKNWCPLLYDPNDTSHTKITDCRLSGQREVLAQSTFTSPAGTFKDCYDLVDHYNGGIVLQKFCTGVGVVSLTFDNVGTKLGFQQTLSSYTPGLP